MKIGETSQVVPALTPSPSRENGGVIQETAQDSFVKPKSLSCQTEESPPRRDGPTLRATPAMLPSWEPEGKIQRQSQRRLQGTGTRTDMNSCQQPEPQGQGSNAFRTRKECYFQPEILPFEQPRDRIKTFQYLESH